MGKARAPCFWLACACLLVCCSCATFLALEKAGTGSIGLLPLVVTGSRAHVNRFATQLSPSRLVRRAIGSDLDANEHKIDPIRISDQLPSKLQLPSSVLAGWDEALEGLSAAAMEATKSTLKLASIDRKIHGIPGTGIEDDDEAEALQAHLDCMSGKGEWVYDEVGTDKTGLMVHKQESIHATCDKRFYKGRDTPEKNGNTWDVRESLKWRWVPSASCRSTAVAGSLSSQRLSRRRFCELLAHKSTLLVGDLPQFSLHDMLLDWTSLKPQTCYGDLYCKKHSLCRDVLSSDRDVESWDADERVYNPLPKPPGGLQKREVDDPEPADDDDSVTSGSQDSHKYKSAAEGTYLRFQRADGLRHATAQTAPTYTHPATGVREVNQQWMADSRRWDILILTKAPVPLPAKGRNETWDDLFSIDDTSSTLDQQARKMVEATWRMTEDVWLPELLDTLRAVRGPSAPPNQLVVYRGGWRSHHDCGASNLPEEDIASTWHAWSKNAGDGPPPRTLQPSLAKLLFRTRDVNGRVVRSLVDQHTLFFNLQTVMQNHLVRTIVAPAFGMPFLDLETSSSVWRSGMVGGSAATPFQSRSTDTGSFGSFVDQIEQAAYGSGIDIGLRSAASGDCSRYCWPSPGGAVEEAFIGGLTRSSKADQFRSNQIFERGWATTSSRRAEWVGDGFTNIVDRSL
ncbi:hypothetical protein OIO90_002543 [Microbotryomycetes sp. JL221]|nr:hypothetical protein OIO90_002543 [Microbotryomycetes sp. JL221]